MSCRSTELSAKKAPCRVLFPGADGGNRTRVASLGSWSPAIRRHPHYYCCASYCTPDLWIMQAKNACHSVGAYSSVTHHCNSCIRMRKSYWITFAISIHAPHVGRDSKSVQKFAALLRKLNNFLFREAKCRTASAQKPPPVQRYKADFPVRTYQQKRVRRRFALTISAHPPHRIQALLQSARFWTYTYLRDSKSEGYPSRCPLSHIDSAEVF